MKDLGERDLDKLDKKKNGIPGWVTTVSLTVVICLFLNFVVVYNFHVPSASMEPELEVGDWIMGYRQAYLFSEPERFDIVFFTNEEDEPDLVLIKRIIALPGETIEGKDNVIYINSKALTEGDYTHGDLEEDFGPYTVPEDSYFVMGDNREDSEDSREWVNPFVSKSKIMGKAKYQYVPKIKSLN